MAKIVPFRGLYFNPEKITDLSRVVTPPYDAMTPEVQERYSRRSPFNVANLIRRHDAQGEEGQYSRYGRAAREFEKWRNEKVLLREEQHVLYLCEQQYEAENGTTAVRHGFLALARIEDFASGVVKPHEATASEAKADRFHLIKACSANFSPVFSLYSDPCSVLEALTSPVLQQPPQMAVTDDDGVATRVWRIADPAVIGKIQALLHGKSLFIADGHHRYETALAYRDFMREMYPDYIGREVFNYVMMFFTNIEDPGVRIDPVHRCVKLPGSFDIDDFLQRLKPYFTIEGRSFDPGDEDERRRVLSELAARGREEHVLALFAGDGRLFFLTLVDESVTEDLFSEGTSRTLRCLDVSILHKLVLQRLLGFEDDGDWGGSRVRFVTSAAQCFDGVSAGDYTLAFLVNPVELKDVRDIANAGEKMPRKSTFFYPKLLSGLVINPIEGRETVGP